MERTQPDSLHGEAARTQPHPLAALALVVAIPGTYALAVSMAVPLGDHRDGFVLYLVCGIAVVTVVGSGILGVWRTLILAIASYASLTLSGLVLFAVAFASICGNVSHPFHVSVAIGAGAVYAAVAYWAIRTGRNWVVPLAVLLGLGVYFGVTFALPGVPNLEPCSD